MRTLLRLFVIILVCSLFVQEAATQPTVFLSPVGAGGLEIFFLKDFDVNSAGSGPPIFNLELRNDDVNRTLFLVMVVGSRRFGEIARGQSLGFPLDRNEIVMLTSKNLFTNSGPYHLDEFSIADEIVRELLQDILSTGKLPSDVYLFQVQLFDVNGPISAANDEFEIRVTNPRKLDLIFPGTAATGRRDDCIEMFTRLPQFRWESDMQYFVVTIAEAKPGEDPESALNQEPRFVRSFTTRDRRGSADSFCERSLGRPEFIPGTSFQYPGSGEVLTFRPGKTYYWRVTGCIEASGGPVQLKSEIFCFRMARIDELGTGRQQIMFILENFLGSDAEKLFAEGGELEGYRPRKVLFDGKETTLPEILTRLQDLNERYQGYRIE